MPRVKSLIFALVVGAIGTAFHPTMAGDTSSRDDSLREACLEAGRLTGAVGDAQWCQCENDYYAGFLSDEDWQTYTSDYFALSRKKYSEKKTEPYSYDRYVQIGDSACRICKENGYRGCLRDDGVTPSIRSYDRLFRDLRDGQFERIQKNTLYKNFFVDFINGYSASCGDRMTSYVERTVTVTRWKSINQVWYHDDTDIFKTRIDPDLVDLYKAYEKAAELESSVRMLEGLYGAMQKGQFPSSVVKETLDTVVKPSILMDRMFVGKCTSPDVQVAYGNLKRFELGQAAKTLPAFVEARQRADAAQAAHYAKIRAEVATSLARSKAIYEAEKARKALLPKGDMYCDPLYQRSREEATTVQDLRSGGGKSLRGFEGIWTASIGDQPLELALWNTGRQKDYVIGFGYFPEDDCLMTLRFSQKGRPGNSAQRIVFMDMSVFSPQWRPGNCKSMAIDDPDTEVQRFHARGFIAYDTPEAPIEWYLSQAKLGTSTPQTCAGKTTELAPGGKISPAFATLLRQYKYPDRYAEPVPEAVLAKVK
ncbi:MAG: hypothetical protein ACWA5T_07605 [Parvularcula sp.]